MCRFSFTVAFGYCGSLTSISFPEATTSLGENLFQGCTQLVSIELPSRLAVLGRAALAYSSIRTIVLPDSVTSVGHRAYCNVPHISAALLTTPTCLANAAQ